MAWDGRTIDGRTDEWMKDLITICLHFLLWPKA